MAVPLQPQEAGVQGGIASLHLFPPTTKPHQPEAFFLEGAHNVLTIDFVVQAAGQ